MGQDGIAHRGAADDVGGVEVDRIVDFAVPFPVSVPGELIGSSIVFEHMFDPTPKHTAVQQIPENLDRSLSRDRRPSTEACYPRIPIVAAELSPAPGPRRANRRRISPRRTNRKRTDIRGARRRALRRLVRWCTNRRIDRRRINRRRTGGIN